MSVSFAPAVSIVAVGDVAQMADVVKVVSAIRAKSKKMQAVGRKVDSSSGLGVKE